jgi:DNA mismatch repair protein MutS
LKNDCTVTYFVKPKNNAEELKKLIRSVGDLERLISKVSLEKVNPREMTQLKRALLAIVQLRKIFGNESSFIGENWRPD